LAGRGFDAQATSGEKGQYDVVADGRLVFSKERMGRFPETSEILSALE
jgi:hypothetical protein